MANIPLAGSKFNSVKIAAVAVFISEGSRLFKNISTTHHLPL